MKWYAIYDENWNVVESIKANRKPNSRSMVNDLGDTRPEVLKIIDQTVTMSVPTFEENGDPILDENGDPVMEDIISTYKRLTINLTAKTTADAAKAVANTANKWDKLRQDRDSLLVESDALWVEASSKGESVTDINTYKQELRDWPVNELDIDNPTAPVKP